MYTIDQIISFLQRCSGRNKVGVEDDFEYDLGITGDDFFELIES